MEIGRTILDLGRKDGDSLAPITEIEFVAIDHSNQINSDSHLKTNSFTSITRIQPKRKVGSFYNIHWEKTQRGANSILVDISLLLLLNDI